jgi:outer membrane receptor protein involved in Fe transport
MGTGETGLPEIDFGGTFENLGASGFSIPRGRTSQSFQILDNFTWLKGRHTMKFGGEYRRAAISSFNNNLERGLFSFGSDPSGLALCPGSPTDPVECSDAGAVTLANYYLGNTFPSVDTGNTQRNTFNNGLAFFAQDDFRVAPKFTLNYGMRWEYFGPLGEKNNLLSNLGTDGNLAMVGTDGLHGAYNRDLNNFGPRVGFAWSALSKTVLRGGYGIYFDYIPQDLMIANFTTSVRWPRIDCRSVPLANSWTNRVEWYHPGEFGNSPIPPPYSRGADIFFTPRNLVIRTQNWNLNVERELSGTWFSTGHIGGRGTAGGAARREQPDMVGNQCNYGFGRVRHDQRLDL